MLRFSNGYKSMPYLTIRYQENEGNTMKIDNDMKLFIGVVLIIYFLYLFDAITNYALQ